MTQSLYDIIMEEMHSREAYQADVYAPYYICSYAVHAFNLMNQTREIYFVGKQLPNMRLHLLFISPSGFMKTYYGNVMGSDPNAIFAKTSIGMAKEQSLCLPAGQCVNRPDGTLTPIENIRVGDNVLAYTPDLGIHSTVVTATHSMPSDVIVKITTQDGRQLSMTPNHPVLTINGWKEIQQVSVGESIACPRHYQID